MTPIPRSARILDPLVYKRRAFGLTDAVFAIRDGFFNLRFSIIPLTRIQSVSVRQGPVSAGVAWPPSKPNSSRVR